MAGRLDERRARDEPILRRGRHARLGHGEQRPRPGVEPAPVDVAPRGRPGDQEGEHAREGVAVRGGAHLAARPLLGRRVRRRADPVGLGRHGVGDRGETCQPEVREVGRPVGAAAQQDVRRLHVPVHQAGRVRGVQGGGHLLDHGHGRRRVDRSVLGDERAQVDAVDQLHDEHEQPLVLARVVHGHHVAVVEAGDGAHLAPEPLGRADVCVRGRHELDGDVPLEAQLPGTEHRAAAAGADLLEQPAAEHLHAGEVVVDPPCRAHLAARRLGLHVGRVGPAGVRRRGHVPRVGTRVPASRPPWPGPLAITRPGRGSTSSPRTRVSPPSCPRRDASRAARCAGRPR